MNVSTYVQTIDSSIRDMWHVKRSGKGAMSADAFVDWYNGKYGIPRGMIWAVVREEDKQCIG